MAELNPLIKQRYSPVIFTKDPVTNDQLMALMEAARWAPSSFNEQPWVFVVANGFESDARKDFLSCMDKGNRDWAKTAPLLMVTVAKSFFGKNMEPNPHAWHDVGLAMGNLILQAETMGLKVHQMAGFDADKVRSLLTIPTGYDPVAMVAIGVEGNPEKLKGDLKERALTRTDRKDVSTIVYSEAWGLPL